MNNLINKHPTLVAFAIIFLAMLLPSIFTPMQSDDYSYALMGVSPEAHIFHYMHWSGRLVADFVSGSLLAYLPHWFYSLINAAGVASLMVCIYMLPAFIIGNHDSKKSLFGPILIFILYWIANPNLGQTSFWIVGSANYMWTNLFICLFLITLFHFLNKKCNIWAYILVGFLGVLAGCSNENTSVVVILITVFVCFYEHTKNRILFSVSLSSLIIGALALLLAPGNAERAKRFHAWYSSSFGARFDAHFFERLPELMSSFWQVYFIMILLLLIGTVSKTISDKAKVYALVFFFGALAANAAFLFAPGIPPRSNNGALIFTLISMSFILSSSYKNESWQNITSRACAFALSLFYFVPSYLFITNAWIVADKQAQIRGKIIKENIDNGVKDFFIPDFHFVKLSKKLDAFDTYHSHSFATYFGANKVRLFNVGFDYSPAYFSNPLIADSSIKADIKLKSIYFGDQGYGISPNIIFEFNNALYPTLSKDEIFTAHVYSKSGEIINCDVGTNPVNIQGRFLYSKTLNGVSKGKVDKIVIGLYNLKTKETTNKYTLKM